MKKQIFKSTVARVALVAAILGLALASTLSAKSVMFRVDLGDRACNSTGVHISGSWAEGDWSATLTPMQNEPGTTIYSVVIEMPAGKQYEYKFLNGDQWYDSEFVPTESRVLYDYNDNRWIYVDSLDDETLRLAPVLFAGNAPQGMYLVRFRVDMTYVPNAQNKRITFFTPRDGWDIYTSRMYSFSDKIYEGLCYLPSGDIGYYFLTDEVMETVPADCKAGEGDNYRYFHVDKDTMLPAYVFSSCKDINVLPAEDVTSGSEVQVAPIPSGASDVSISAAGDARIVGLQIIDSQGNTVLNDKLNPSLSITLLRSNFSAGVFLARVATNDGKVTTKKIIFN